MDTQLAALILSVALWALGVVISLLILYMVIRLAVTHALKSHTYWVDRGKR